MPLFYSAGVDLYTRPVCPKTPSLPYLLVSFPIPSILVLELGGIILVKSLIALGWLRDIVLVLLICTGNHLRHSSPAIGFAIMAAALLIFAERFLWAWHICDLRDKHAASSAPR
jgi:hypothetical protein